MDVGNETTEHNKLATALAAGRAVLLLGQRHSPGLVDGFKHDMAAITGRREGDTTIRLLAGLGDDSAIEGLRRALDRHQVAQELVAIAENPWAYVLTTA